MEDGAECPRCEIGVSPCPFGGGLVCEEDSFGPVVDGGEGGGEASVAGADDDDVVFGFGGSTVYFGMMRMYWKEV